MCAPSRSVCHAVSFRHKPSNHVTPRGNIQQQPSTTQQQQPARAAAASIFAIACRHSRDRTPTELTLDITDKSLLPKEEETDSVTTHHNPVYVCVCVLLSMYVSQRRKKIKEKERGIPTKRNRESPTPASGDVRVCA